MKKLDIGCGISKRDGYIGIDQLPLQGVDVIHDLNCFPYPFSENEMGKVWIDNTLEHLENPLKVMEEVHRISNKNAEIIVSVPYFRSFYATIDPTHRAFFGVYWFSYFDPRHAFFKKYSYTKSRFQVERIVFDREVTAPRITQRIVKAFANKWPHFYERNLSHLFPLHSLTYYLTVIKD